MATPDWAADLLLAAMASLCLLHALLEGAQLLRVWQEPRGSLRVWIHGLLDDPARVGNDAHAGKVRTHYHRQRSALYKSSVRMYIYIIGFNLAWATVDVYRFAVHERNEDFLLNKMPTRFNDLFGSGTYRLPVVMYGLYHIGGYASFRLFFTAVASYKFSESIERARQEVFFGLLMSTACLLTVFFPCNWWGSQLMLARMGLAIIHRSTAPTAFWSVMFHLCRFFKLSILSTFTPVYLREVGWVGKCPSPDPWGECVNLFAVVGVSLLVERLAWAEASATVRAREGASERKALSSILAATCDAVVHLDADMRVIGPNPKLAAMLLRPQASVNGVRFKSLVPDDEVATLEQSLQETSENARGGVCARMFRTSIRDADGNTIPIHAYDTLVADHEGVESHLIGVSEILQEHGGQQLVETMVELSDVDTLGADRGWRRHRRHRRSVADIATNGGGGRGDRQVAGGNGERRPSGRPAAAAIAKWQAAAAAKWQAGGDGERIPVAGGNGEHIPMAGGNGEPLPAYKSPLLSAGRLPRRGGGRVRRGQGSGTPPELSSQIFSSSIDNVSDGGRSGRSGSTSGSSSEGPAGGLASKGGVLYPDLELTSQFGMELSIVQAVARWNFHSMNACCSCHAGLLLLSDLARKMRKEACLELGADYGSAASRASSWSGEAGAGAGAPSAELGQCGFCGILRCEPRQDSRCCAVCEQAWLRVELGAGPGAIKCQL